MLGERGGRLDVQLAAPPVDGAANDALCEHFARVLGVSRRQVTLIAGASSRSKRLRVEGVDVAAALAVLK